MFGFFRKRAGLNDLAQQWAKYLTELENFFVVDGATKLLFQTDSYLLGYFRGRLAVGVGELSNSRLNHNKQKAIAIAAWNLRGEDGEDWEEQAECCAATSNQDFALGYLHGATEMLVHLDRLESVQRTPELAEALRKGTVDYATQEHVWDGNAVRPLHSMPQLAAMHLQDMYLSRHRKCFYER